MRLVAARNDVVWGDCSEYDGEEERVFVYQTTVGVLRKRLALAGFDRRKLEEEFYEEVGNRKALLAEHRADYPNEYLSHDELLSQPLDVWLVELKEMVRQGKRIRGRWLSTDGPPEDQWEAILTEAHHYQFDKPVFMLNFPCSTLESFAVAILEGAPEDNTCELDISDLVHGGHVDGFEDLCEQQGPYTSIFGVFLDAELQTKTLMDLAPKDPALTRMLFAHLITAYETYLGDTVRKNVLNRPVLLRRFVERNARLFPEKRIGFCSLFEEMDKIRETASEVIDSLLFHRMDVVRELLRSVFLIEIPKADRDALAKAMEVRHDIVHRGGKNRSGTPHQLTMQDVEDLRATLRHVVGYIDQGVKDGLVDPDDDEEGWTRRATESSSDIGDASS